LFSGTQPIPKANADIIPRGYKKGFIVSEAARWAAER
jgi:hypothetical protein